MNYGKKSTSRKEQQLASKGAPVRRRFSLIFLKTMLVCLFAVVVIGACAGFGALKGIIDSAPDIDEIDATPTGYLSVVLDNQGNEIDTLVASGSNRIYVTIDETTAFEVDEEGNPVIIFPAGTVTDAAHGEQRFRIPKLYA